MPIRPLHVYCADIGAMRNANGKNNFGWAGRRITRNAEAPHGAKEQICANWSTTSPTI